MIKSGFTLVELMIAIAIIAIVAAVSWPQYQRHIARTHVGAALHELDPGRTQYEIKINDGLTDPMEYTADFSLGIPPETTRCRITAAAPAGEAAVGAVKCRLKGTTLTDGRTVQWTRTSNGKWRCETDVPDMVRPTGCVAL